MARNVMKEFSNSTDILKQYGTTPASPHEYLNSYAAFTTDMNVTRSPDLLFMSVTF